MANYLADINENKQNDKICNSLQPRRPTQLNTPSMNAAVNLSPHMTSTRK